MDATRTVRDYYDALRAGDPLGPYFAETEDLVKFGVGERLAGPTTVREGLREQTARTTDWTVESDALRVTDRGCHAWFSDDVFLAWTDTEVGVRFEFDTRWSGTLERRGDDGPDEDGDWRFVGMHVSVPSEV
ncbi:MAG: nuclear transport factor 2 family protein [Halorientalis sp.]